MDDELRNLEQQIEIALANGNVEKADELSKRMLEHVGEKVREAGGSTPVRTGDGALERHALFVSNSILPAFHYAVAALFTVIILLVYIVLAFMVPQAAGMHGFPVWQTLCCLVALIYPALLATAGYSLSRGKNIGLVAFVAALNCLNVPFGTALGAATFIALSRAKNRRIR